MTTLRLDIEHHDELVRYLRESDRIGVDEQPELRTLAGGVSNRAVLVQRQDGDAWVLKQALPKLRVPVDWYCSPKRIEREALALHWLGRLAPVGTITPLVFEDRELHLLAMEAVPQPHENWKTMLLSGQLDLSHVQQFGELLSTIHRKSLVHRDRIVRAFGDRSFFEVLRLEPYYEYTATRVPEAAGFLARLVEETRARRETFVHGDYSPKNVLVRDGRLILLDHEVAHFGDPGFDLGFSLAHLLSKAHHLPQRRGDFAGAALLYWNAYEGEVELEPRVVRHTLGCLLARVAGRSPLEYLDEHERAQQQRAVIRLLSPPPSRVTQLVEQFQEAL
jgi:5-methylthioribose kinase